MEWDRLLVCVVSLAERVIETTDERTWGGRGDSDVLITIRCHSDSEMGEQGFLDFSHSHVPATVTMGSMTTDSSLRVMYVVLMFLQECDRRPMVIT